MADAGGIAEEVISTIRTAQAFGTQKTLAEMFDKPVDQARKTDLKGAFWQGGSLAIFFFLIYAGYALSRCPSLLP